ncbi:MAG: tRNA uridine-5-carboxymethylaminomethyl(34) synthesis GTPase MnmE [Nitrospirae bacterium]|nr:tRNA uridine-5-carboxymethylaminomethyl(34) synthesis GTPase MnmE [Nitrospirota bacterium]
MKRRLGKRAPGKNRTPGKTARSSPSDGTVCAIATPVGEAGIGMIRLSGDDAVPIAARIIQTRNGQPVEDRASHTICLGVVHDPSTGEWLDEIMFAVMRAPRTYTREDTVEVYCHGGTLLLHRILDLLIRQGARLADPGEFTRRAFLNGRIDLTQAEAVMDLIHAKTEAGHRAAMAQMGGELHRRIVHLREEAVHLLAEIEAGIDFTDEDIQFLSDEHVRTQLSEILGRVESLLKTSASGKALREGIATAIIGRPNVGKSSLLNALLMQNRAIVTPVPGTTRDVIEDYLSLDGIPLRIMDTAGLRDTDDLVEREGVIRTRQAIKQADLIILLLDLTQKIGPEDRRLFEETDDKRRLIVFNKVDLLSQKSWNQKQADLAKKIPAKAVYISALTGEGIENLKAAIAFEIHSGIVTCGDREAMINNRHKALLLQVKDSINNAIESAIKMGSAELMAMDIRTAVDRLGEITGATTTEDLLDKIFKEFCIGK